MHQKTPKQLVNSGLKFQALEPRIMFDGAAVFTAAEAIDQLENQNLTQTQTDINQSDSVEILLKNKDTKKEIVFIDKGVDDYQSIVSSIDSSKSIYLIDTQENGFEKMTKYRFELMPLYNASRRNRISSPNRPKIDPRADFDQFSKNQFF